MNNPKKESIPQPLQKWILFIVSGSLALHISIYVSTETTGYFFSGLLFLLIAGISLAIITGCFLYFITKNADNGNFKASLRWLLLLLFGVTLNFTFMHWHNAIHSVRFYAFRAYYEQEIAQKTDLQKISKPNHMSRHNPTFLLWDTSAFAGYNFWTYLVYDPDHSINRNPKKTFSNRDGINCNFQHEINQNYIVVMCQ